MPRSFAKRLTGGLRLSLLVGCLLFVAIYAVIACYRLAYPFELEIGEGDLVYQSLRLRAGEPLYTEPTLAYTPYVYTPLYFYLSAVLMEGLGEGFAAPRMLSFAASLGCMALLVLIVRRETGSIGPGLVSAGLFAATFGLSGGAFDIVRVDSLCLFWMLTTVYLARRDDWGSLLLAGVSAALAFATKQSALFLVLAIGGYCLLARERLKRFVFLATFLVLTAVGTLVSTAQSDGWYLFYVFEMLGLAGVHWDRLLGFWVNDMATPLAVAGGVGLAALLVPGDVTGLRARRYFGFVGAGLVVIAWSSRVHVGGGVNVLVPAHAAVALLFGLGIHGLTGAAGEERSGRPVLALLVVLLANVQILALVYLPQRYLPSSSDLASRRAVVSALASIEGDVLMSYTALLPTLAGKKRFTDGSGYYDVARTDTALGLRLRANTREAVLSGTFAALLVPDGWELAYDRSGRFADAVSELYLDTGRRFRHAVTAEQVGRDPAPARLLIRRDSPLSQGDP